MLYIYFLSYSSKLAAFIIVEKAHLQNFPSKLVYKLVKKSSIFHKSKIWIEIF